MLADATSEPMSSTLNFDAFLARYVDTNINLGSPLFDEPFLVGNLLCELNKTEGMEKIGVCVLAAMCCAMKRADLVPRLFLCLTKTVHEPNSADTISKHFWELREAINIIWPFVGVPQVIPACLGVAGYFESKGIMALSPEKTLTRHGIRPEDADLGWQTRKEIYKASANSEVFRMLSTYFGDFSHALDSIGFGYNIGRATEVCFSLAEVEMILTSSLIALGATRQAGSHIKACIAFGYPVRTLEAVTKVAHTLAQWQGIQVSPSIDIDRLADEAQREMQR
ncbi:uncharacterized protein Z519_09160 [Cladophialophora bantiana CBS 173.52]|uniref:Carboxymuconolactone decarboxylase-like domain-containing protein n=1 Tax=Cladophialophora bantiana (strain ATCC 10958 / CBS 173.52 / CDC B-1940 / NIH 8579) TaxID=1442370 RepID=A0A0D2HBD6_CLAB1|nr:uncharacterized protein Z519_09160 [Cladophialophora bantiana CBS 173.52]KIW90513.1 hypothetical protein Z519_09160 [Cladophialophora bantiana CBS 173.52]